MSHATRGLQAVIERLENVEAQNRRMKRAGLAALVLAASAFLIGSVAPGSRTIRAREFILLGPDGAARAKLTIAGETAGGPGLVLLDRNGLVRARLAVTAEGPDLILADETEKVRARLAVSEIGPRLVLNDADERHRALLIATEHGASLGLLNASQMLRARLAAIGDLGEIDLYDTEGERLFARPRKRPKTQGD
jgi:hypothetical protein